MTFVKGKDIITSGQRAAGITDAINLRTKNLPPIYMLHDIDLLLFEVKETNILQSICRLSEEGKKIGQSPYEENAGSDSDWTNDAGVAFDLFNDLKQFVA